MPDVISASVRIGRRHRGIVTLTLYGLIATIGYTLAFLVRFGFELPALYASILLPSLVLLVLLRVLSFAAARLHRTTWRFAGTSDLLRLGIASAVATLAFLLISEARVFGAPIPRVIVLLEAGITANLTAAGWLSYRALYEFMRSHRLRVKRKGALIVGAGEAGHLLAHEIQRSGLGYRLLGFIDDDPDITHAQVCGTEVLGTTDDLARIVTQTEADELLISPHWHDRQSFRRIIAACQLAGLPMKVLPAFSDMVRGDGLLARLRAVRVEDLLGRDPVQLALPELAVELNQRSVLITGAAGSIGSELTRQVAMHRPARLVLFDQDETRLYYIELEIREQYPDVLLVPIIGDITNPAAVERVFRRYRPDQVFHAAAYKHVPMMETNAVEAIRNNLIATRHVAATSGEYEAEKFVLMSTDKAVRPCSVMGATKHLAELAVIELQQLYPDTTFCGVRFGNVLGSNGSVLPIFERQLDAGRPLTVTHPEVTRYFMTIPEAVQLILQASLLPDIHGRLAMLEMGAPVRILELAQNFLQLAGRGDNHGIVFTGLRRGERLHEELVAPDELTVETEIAKVRLVLRPPIADGEIGRLIENWAEELETGDEASVIRQLRQRFPDLTVPAEISDRPAAVKASASARGLVSLAGAVHFQPDADES
ncbi:MAG TPA: nucleoside-diphosphate sugar epimerase/dehydratase [Longimicrobiales bacterium]|nr:nucleoside-diphosphate sugar epimerase/dehydratase [Longimicrobiales bacterium]